MARKTIDFIVTTPGRDLDKVFRITEMAPRKAEHWGNRAINAMAKSVGGISPAMLASGMQGIAIIGISAFARASWSDIEPLLEEMYSCIQIVPDPARPGVARSLHADDDIEEVSTLLLLRQEVLELHTGFFKDAVSWILTAAQQSLQQLKAAENLPNTETSPPLSEP